MNNHKCKQCGKPFDMPDSGSYAYHSAVNGNGKTYYFCSWTCLQKFRDETGITAQEKKEKEKIERELRGEVPVRLYDAAQLIPEKERWNNRFNSELKSNEITLGEVAKEMGITREKLFRFRQGNWTPERAKKMDAALERLIRRKNGNSKAR